MLSSSQLIVIVWFCISHLSYNTNAFQSLTNGYTNNHRIQQQYHQDPLVWIIPLPVTTKTKRTTTITNTQLHVIKAEDNDFVFDEGAGGVRLATESIIKLTGTVKHSPGKVEPSINELIRYFTLQKLSDKIIIEKQLNDLGGVILCTGSGKELYKDPGTSTDAVIVLSSFDAVKNAISNAKSAMTSTSLVLNFAGSTDSQVLEVLESIRKLILSLDVPTKTKITFNSISSSDVQPLTTSVTVISFDEKLAPTTTNEVILSNIDKAIASGEIYFIQGSYYTLSADDINTAVA